MSYDGSSAKSYIRHATEKERLDNLAFASFPEDYLPYASPGHSSRAGPPPYLLWGDDRRRRPPKKGRRCAGALLCAIGLVVAAILAVVAVSVYLGVVTNLFRSPVVSVSGRFTASDEEFSHEMLNSSSSKFLEKAQLYKSKVEKAFYSSSLEPAFIAARIYSFRPGLVVYFRVYLDRRKMREESPAAEMVRNLVAQRVAPEPDSVHVQESEELLGGPSEDNNNHHPPFVTTSTTKQPASKEKNDFKLPSEWERPPPSHSEGVGEWRPVPIEDSVSPSFADGAGLMRSPDEASRRRPEMPPPPVRLLREGTGQKAPRLEDPLLPAEGVGSVRLIEESPTKRVPPPRQAGGEPPTLAPSVSLVVRKPRPDKRLAKVQQEGGPAEGVGSVREIAAEVDPPHPPPLQDRLAAEISDPGLDPDHSSGTPDHSSGSASTALEGTETDLDAASTALEGTETDLDAASTALEGTETDLYAASTALEGTETDLDAASTALEGTETDSDSDSTEEDSASLSTLESILFSRASASGDISTRADMSTDSSATGEEDSSTASSIRSSSIINYSQYLFDERHYRANASSEDDFHAENATSDDASQQAKVVPQVQSSDILSNDIAEEVLRHVTPTNNDSLSESCPPGSVPCGDDRGTCGVRCDLRRDCPDNADETGCACSELLRAMGQAQKICDGLDDCRDKSDETGCPWCPSEEEHFVCPGSRSCVPLDQVCDGKDDCPGGQDEKRCVSLSNSSDAGGSSGYLMVRKGGRWGKLCLDTLSDTDSRIPDLGRAVCSALTYRNMTSSVRATYPSGSEDSFYRILTDAANNRSSEATSIFEPTSCDGKKVLRVTCRNLECGLRPSSSSQRRRIVGGSSAEGPGAWPWSAALYREGEFQCGAALLSDTWMLSAAHCFYSSPLAHWTARLGVLRRGSELPSGGEQVRRVAHISLHPEYEDVGFINDIALLRMEAPVHFSDTLRPICLPSSPKEDATLWHGQRCSVVGWGKLYEIGHTFPDSLQEVRLPVISSSECQKRSLFLPAYRITPRMFCAGYDRGGRDACLGDSGGPMACQRPADGRWILLGVTSNGDGCGRPGRPGVYSQVSSFLDWIQDTMLRESEGGATGSESLCRDGVRCRLGRCVPRSRMCDGRRDCAGGEDEDGC